MIKNLARGLGALSLALVPLLSAPAAQAAPTAEVTTLADAVGLVEVAEEDRTGFTRLSFKHWNSGADVTDVCNTRNEVLLAEAVVAPTLGAGCKLTGGTWTSYDDGQEVTSAGALDIDHMVPLAEVWNSGASAWTAARREAYANDQSTHVSLVAVTAQSNQQKGDQDPSESLRPRLIHGVRAAREIPVASAAREVAAPTTEALMMAPKRFGVRRLVFLCRRDHTGRGRYRRGQRAGRRGLDRRVEPRLGPSSL
ncbi:HNH endonuclease family protein [Streptomyces sp. b62]|uniref:HNH endonuclease family protein n=1 Tax=Streptomyces sp. b62 TaxID=1827627 RepID=UPI00211D1E3D|nr:HNH endonuclease family protein [Streptomyces sp. b62]